MREIAALKPEIAHLRSQNQSQQSAISEKQALERQVGLLEVELQNTKRSLDRLRQQDSQHNEQLGRPDPRFEQLNRDYLGAKEDRDKLEKEVRSEASRRRALEQTVNDLEGKLEATTEHLRQAQDRLRHRVQARASGQPIQPTADASRSRRPTWFESGIEIATPGDVKVTSRGQKSLALPGDKSSFSITPFLNRTSRGTTDQDITSEEESEQDKGRRSKSRGAESEKSAGQGRPRPASGGESLLNDRSVSSDDAGALPEAPRPSKQSMEKGANGPVVGNQKKEPVSKKRAPNNKRPRSQVNNARDEPNDSIKPRKLAALEPVGIQGRQSEAGGLRPIRRLGTGAAFDAGFGFSPLKRNARAP
jgi:21S rRNA (uridine2791-2'-O)-methyltransferase